MRIFLGALAASLLYAGTVCAQELSPTPLPEASASRTQTILQKDPRWGRIRLGEGTVGSKGCLLVSIAKAIAERDSALDPAYIIRQLASRTFVERNGDLKWDMVSAVFGIQVIDRFAVSKAVIAQVGDRLAQGYRVFLKLEKPGGRSHWVQAVEVQGNDIALSDPAYGSVNLIAFYGKPKKGSEIVVIGGD
jgi:hypothetical protein